MSDTATLPPPPPTAAPNPPGRRESLLTRGKDRPRGEVYVWLTATGLAIGLVMIVGLLALIAKNGLTVFWPARVAQIQLADGAAGGPLGATVFFGEIVQERDRTLRELDADGKQQPPTREFHVFTGNKDVFGSGFVYVDARQLKEISYPENVLVAERVEYGDAICVPVSLKLPDGRVVPASDPGFRALLDGEMAAANERREEINRIVREEIGPYSRELSQLGKQEKFYSGKGNLTAAERELLAKIPAERERILAAQAPAQAKINPLQQAQTAATFTYRIAGGQEVSKPVGMFIYAYAPNALSFPGRVKVFAHQLWEFLSGVPREANTEGGIFPAIFGTFVMTLLLSLAVTPFGVLAAIYLREYARQGLFVRCVRIAVNNLAGVPSIVFGVFGLGFFVYMVGGTIDNLFYPMRGDEAVFGTGGIMWAALTLALMTVPVVIVASEEALAAVPRGVREGSLACGASKWQTIQRLVLPASAPGILTGLILAMARGAGEVAPLMLVGVVKLAPTLPLDGSFPFIHLDRKFMHLGFHIYDLGFQSPDSEAAKPMVFATILLLILLVVVLNLGAILIRNHLRKKYQAGVF